MIARESVGEVIKRERVERGISQRLLAAKVGVGVPHISKVEADREAPSDALLTRIAEALELDADALMLAAGRVPPWLVQALTADPAYGLTVLRGLAVCGVRP